MTAQQQSILAAMQSLPDRTAVRRISQALQAEITTMDMKPLEDLHLVKMVEVAEPPIIRYSLTPGGDKLATDIHGRRRPPLHTPEMARAIPTSALRERVSRAMLAWALAEGRSLAWMSAKFDATVAGLRQLMSDYGLSAKPANQPEPEEEKEEMPRGIPSANRPSHEELLTMAKEYKAAGKSRNALAADLHIRPNVLSRWISVALNSRLKSAPAAQANVAAGSGGAAPIITEPEPPAPPEGAQEAENAVCPRCGDHCFCDLGQAYGTADSVPGECSECLGTGVVQPDVWNGEKVYCDCPLGSSARIFGPLQSDALVPARVAEPTAPESPSEGDCTLAQAEASEAAVVRAEGNGLAAPWYMLDIPPNEAARLERQNINLRDQIADRDATIADLTATIERHTAESAAQPPDRWPQTAHDLCCEIESLKSQNAYLRDATTEPLLLCQVGDMLTPVPQVGLLPQVGDHYPEPIELDGRMRYIIWECVAAGMIGQRPVRVLRMVLDTADAGKAVA